MKLIIQPDAGVAPVVTAIKQAKKSIDILIFRLRPRGDYPGPRSGRRARRRRSRPHRPHPYRQRQGPAKLELGLLAAGVTVSRTADDLIRYHGKMMIVDGRDPARLRLQLHRLDIAKSRSLGVITKNPKLVQEALKLFKADDTRQPYTAGCDRFVVSPENARERLAAFISGARKQLLIYDPQVTDDAMLRLITQRINAGVDVRIIGEGRSRSGRSRAKSIRASGFTCAPSSVTAAGRSSAARASGVFSSRSAARSASSSTTGAWSSR